ncbi:hypothetical protein SAMN05660841_02758 [Sphingobacterium nematocida]|uniref:Lipoprotein n=1 Tax=Sphingobacterium nematocida TaxID=1513896 RepID=A0A1T5ES30_9SPHI|nr:hypothetical protein [Sphingobacterium nematocida]SKB86802.1 hypothetical protein SAMN05660841_02758 [Sphingobacterium nematocida]
MKYLILTVFFIGLFLFVSCGRLNAQEKENGKKLIQLAIGDATKWENTRYLLYTVTGPSLIPGFSNERTFLIDKTTGDCRFEGVNKSKENIVILFNYKSKKLRKHFIGIQEAKDNIDSILESILQQFFTDTQILFSPALLSDNPSNIRELSQKIINTDKITIIDFTGLPTLGNSTVDGRMSLTSKGEIKSIVIDNVEYMTSVSKDIGGGIILPTIFESQFSYRFQTVAAFTDIETGKFNNL